MRDSKPQHAIGLRQLKTHEPIGVLQANSAPLDPLAGFKGGEGAREGNGGEGRKWMG